MFNIRISAYSFILTVIVIWIHAVAPASAADAEGVSADLRAVLENILGTSLGQLAVPGFFCMSGYLFFRSFGASYTGDTSVRTDRKWRHTLLCPASYTGDISACADHVSAIGVHAGTDSSSNTMHPNARDCTQTHAYPDGGADTAFEVSHDIKPDNVQAACNRQSTAALLSAKLKSRVRTILIPYLLWNSIYYLIYATAGRRPWGIQEFMDALVNYSCNPVFWYLHELIIITVLTPVIYICLRKRTAAIVTALVVFAAAVCYDRLPVHIVNEDALFYYVTGALLALHFQKYEENAEAIRQAAAACFLIFVICSNLRMSSVVLYVMAGTIGARLSGLLGLFFAVSIVMKTKRQRREYEKYNFLIYAMHYLELRLIAAIFDAACICAFGRGLYETAWLSVSSYVLMPLFCIMISVPLGSMMKRYIPGLYSILTGGRT